MRSLWSRSHMQEHKYNRNEKWTKFLPNGSQFFLFLFAYSLPWKKLFAQPTEEFLLLQCIIFIVILTVNPRITNGGRGGGYNLTSIFATPFSLLFFSGVLPYTSRLFISTFLVHNISENTVLPRRAVKCLVELHVFEVELFNLMNRNAVRPKRKWQIQDGGVRSRKSEYFKAHFIYI
jgi:hypothetical protein